MTRGTTIWIAALCFAAAPALALENTTGSPLNFSSRNGATLQMEVAVKPGGTKASVKGTLIDMTLGDGTTFLCTFAAKRTATKGPVFEACPI